MLVDPPTVLDTSVPLEESMEHYLGIYSPVSDLMTEVVAVLQLKRMRALANLSCKINSLGATLGEVMDGDAPYGTRWCASGNVPRLPGLTTTRQASLPAAATEWVAWRRHAHGALRSTFQPKLGCILLDSKQRRTC